MFFHTPALYQGLSCGHLYPPAASQLERAHPCYSLRASHMSIFLLPHLSLCASLLSCVCAVEVKSGADGFLIKMRDGRLLKCAHNNPEGNPLPDYAPQPAIVLKMEDGSNLLLPIIVSMSLCLLRIPNTHFHSRLQSF